MGTERPNGSLYTKVSEQVATVEFGHPAGNSFVRILLDRLTGELENLSRDPGVSVIVLKSEGDRAFCAGASIDEMQQISNPEEGTAFFAGFANLINIMRRSSKPIIGRVHGKAVGGGVGLIAACDYVFATEAAAIRLSELAIGIAPLVIAPAVTRKTGDAGFAELALSPEEWKNAYWALEKGLFSKVFPDTRSMDKELFFFAQKMASYNTDALAVLKKALWEGTDHWDELLMKRAELSGKLALSPGTRVVLEKFKK
jgi:methylglutaconyl-CoA hydratase